jgi:hypothetical protein
MTIEINQKFRMKLRNACITSAQSYNRLINKNFLIITENNEIFEIVFNRSDFVHLTGIKFNLPDIEVYQKSVKSLLSEKNINLMQKYNKNTIKNKIKSFQSIDKMIYSDVQDTLFLKILKTNTYTFPIGIRNDKKNTAIGFLGKDCHARTLRKARTSTNTKEELRIIAIFEKVKSASQYEKIVYVKNRRELNNSIDKTKKLSKELEDKLFNK